MELEEFTMARYTEGERNLAHYLKYGTFPAPPQQFYSPFVKGVGGLGNDISTIVGTHYQGERTPRQIQKLPLWNYYFSQAYPAYPPSSINIPTPFGQVQSTTDWLLIGGLALGLLALFGLVGFKGY